MYDHSKVLHDRRSVPHRLKLGSRDQLADMEINGQGTTSAELAGHQRATQVKFDAAGQVEHRAASAGK